MKRSPIRVTPEQVEARRTKQLERRHAAALAARITPRRTTRPVHNPTAVVDLVIARSLRAFDADPDDYPHGLCELCGRPGENTHTRRPCGMGGSKRPETYRASNKVRVCGQGNVTRCHGHLERNRTWARERGLLVPQKQDPAKRAVELAYGLVLLDDHGGYQPATTNPTTGEAAA